MTPTTEGSKIVNFDICAMSWKKDHQKEIEVIEGATKNSIFDDKMEIRVENGELREDDILATEDGRLLKFPKDSYKTVKNKENSVIKYAELLKNKNNNERDIG